MSSRGEDTKNDSQSAISRTVCNGLHTPGWPSITRGSQPPSWFAAQTLDTVGLMQVSKLRSGKADGVSAQHTERRLFEITGTASRRSGPVKPNAVLDPERRILCQRTTAKNTSRKWTSTRPAVLRPCVEPTSCSPTRGVRVANVSTPLVRKQTLGSSGEQQVNGYRDVRTHSRRYAHRSSVKTNNPMAKPHRN
jgi:hypothetical protein